MFGVVLEKVLPETIFAGGLFATQRTIKCHLYGIKVDVLLVYFKVVSTSEAFPTKLTRISGARLPEIPTQPLVA